MKSFTSSSTTAWAFLFVVVVVATVLDPVASFATRRAASFRSTTTMEPRTSTSASADVLDVDVDVVADPEEVVAAAVERMDRAVATVRRRLSSVRMGRAAPELLRDVRVRAHGVPTPVSYLATVAAVGARTLTVEPYDPSTTRRIARAVVDAPGLGLNLVGVDEGRITLEVPPLDEEARGRAAKRCRALGEEGKVALRCARREGNHALTKTNDASDDESRRLKTRLQTATDDRVEEVKRLVAEKEKDVTTL